MTKLRPRRLVQRVAWSACAAIAGGATCVALVTGVLADRFAQQRERGQLTDAARVLAVELVEPGADPRFVAADEARELLPTNIRVAVYEGTRLFAGDGAIPTPGSPGCTDAALFTSCAVRNSRFLAVAARDTAPLREQRRSLLLASALAVAATSLLGAFLARRIAIALVAPLSRLGAALEHVKIDAAETVELGTDEGVEEVDLLRATLQATFARLGHALATSQRFAADAAHELRSPLTVIMGQLELNTALLEGQARDSNERARRTAASLSTLVNRLLVLATPAAKLALTEQIELHSIADDALDLLPVAAWPRVSVASAPDVYVKGDRALLAAMLSNAIENALKFSHGPVQVELLAGAEFAELRVSDSGPGIAEADRQRVFEPFFRTRATRASGTRGHGIGLALIVHVCTVHGGSAAFAARDSGATLIMRLPRIE